MRSACPRATVFASRFVRGDFWWPRPLPHRERGPDRLLGCHNPKSGRNVSRKSPAKVNAAGKPMMRTKSANDPRGHCGPKANSQAYPVDVTLPSRLLSPSWVLGCAEERPLPSHSSGLFFCVGGRASKKGTKVLPKPWPPDHALRKVGALLCAIHKSNVTVALLFQTLIELKKTGRHSIRDGPKNKCPDLRSRG